MRPSRRVHPPAQLVSVELVDANGEVVSQPYGARPAGKLTYTPTGHMWALTARRDIPRGDPAGAQWYTGTFDVTPGGARSPTTSSTRRWRRGRGPISYAATGS